MHATMVKNVFNNNELLFILFNNLFNNNKLQGGLRAPKIENGNPKMDLGGP